MKLLEYKAKELFEKYGVPVRPGVVIDEAGQAAERIEAADLAYPVVIKAQVQIGGRGKAGGIRFADNPQQAEDISRELLRSKIRDLEVRQLLITQAVEIEREWYLSFVLDRKSKSTMLVFSAMGGVDIEDTAKTDPDKIIKLPVDPELGIQDYDVRYILVRSGLDMSLLGRLGDVVRRLYDMYNGYHCLLAEINPLAVVEGGDLVALDGKVDIDDSALYMLPDMQLFKEFISVDSHPLTVEAEKYGFLYIPVVDGGSTVAMSNGSGMLMNCVDMLVDRGVSVSAAMDLGGGATAERIREAVRIILKTPGVKSMFVSIFGGLTRCDEVARGIRDGLADSGLDIDMVIRMEGTNREDGIDILKDIPTKLNIVDWPHEGVRILETRGAGH